MPLVSVIIPTYNRPVFLRRAVRSVLKQTFSDLEIIVINDGGDDPRILVPELENKKVKFINLDTNRERSVARNIGIDRSSGKYIAYLDDDDMFYPNHISILTRTLNENRSFKIVYSDDYRAYQVITSHGVKTILKDVPYSVDFSDADLFVQNYIPILCVMHDIEVVEKV
jgi:glycosyltransferase involved in cell wall biosynthesis